MTKEIVKKIKEVNRLLYKKGNISTTFYIDWDQYDDIVHYYMDRKITTEPNGKYCSVTVYGYENEIKEKRELLQFMRKQYKTNVLS